MSRNGERPQRTLSSGITLEGTGLHTGTPVRATLKPATLSTGAVVRVPLFVDQGETIKVDTRSREYVSRVK